MIKKVRKMIDSYKLKQWQNELKNLSEETGITLEDVCEYLGVRYSRDIGFYTKLPKKRRNIIAIGMAFRQSLDTINRWITYYGMKRRLYSKDITEDLIWIYLIRRNALDTESDINYYKLYDECQRAAFETYLTIWNEVTAGSIDTSDVDKRLEEIRVSDDLEGIKEFVINNTDSFKTAYSKPRMMLSKYLRCILDTNARASGSEARDSLISLRGWLDDSMINYLSGSNESINVIEKKSGRRIADIKKVPKSRKSHITLAMALGMTHDEIDRYLELMGFLPLDEDDPDENNLIKEMDKWEAEHPLQRQLKDKYIEGDDSIMLEPEDEQQAVIEMLTLRQDLRDRYKRKRLKFEYMKE